MIKTANGEIMKASKIILQLSLILTLQIFAFTSYAKIFQNSYISFELPDNWGCELEGTEWVCVNKFTKKFNEKKEAVIILTAKEKGPSDTLEAYETHLKTPRKLINAKAQAYNSEMKQVKQRKIALQTWVDGLHLGSEVQNYYTRYLATTKGQIAMLVTFTAHKEHYSKYANDFIRAIQSLKIIAADEILAGSSNQLKRREQDLYALPVGGVLGEGLGDEGMYEDDNSGPGNGKITKILIGVLLLAAGGAGFYLLNKGKNKTRR